MRKTLYDFCIETHSGLLAEWDAEKNAPLTPRDVSYGSKRRAWWRCEKVHSWEAVISSRTRGSRCPVCAGMTAEAGVNDLATLYPQLMDEWAWEKNTGLRPETLLPNSHKKAWWRCENGHEWCSDIKVRTRGSGCPYCADRAIAPEHNSLAAAFPRLAAEWASELNGALTPRDVAPGSRRKVWWRCERGHTWLAEICSRTRGSGCPYCAGKRISPGENDLASVNPRLAAEWDSERNGALTPREVTEYSNRRVWWRCPLGHEYQAGVSARSKGSGCPYCAGRRVLPGFNDLASQEPKVAAEWAQDLNGGLTPEMVTTGSHRRVWWRCPEGHVWRAVIYSRARGDRCGCPVCAGKVRRRAAEYPVYYAP